MRLLDCAQATPALLPLPDRIDRAPLLAPYARVRDADLRTWPGSAHGLFMAESPSVIGAALDAGCRPVSLLVEEGLLPLARTAANAQPARASGDMPPGSSCAAAELPPTDRVLALARRIAHAHPTAPLLVAPPQEFAALVGYTNPRCALVAFERPAPVPVSSLLAGARRVAVLEDVGNYANIGAAFRAASAFGVDAVLVTPSCHDPLFRRAARTSRGAVLCVPWARIGTQRAWAREGIPQLHAAGFKVAAFALEDRSIPLGHPALAHEPRLAIVLGTEGAGLHPDTIARADYVVRIPMAAGVDSLNVAAASAVAFWELRAARG